MEESEGGREREGGKENVGFGVHEEGKASETCGTARNEGYRQREKEGWESRGGRLIDYLKSQTPDCSSTKISNTLGLMRISRSAPAGRGSTCFVGAREESARSLILDGEEM